MAGVLVPASHHCEENDAGERQQREPGETLLAARQDEKRRDQRGERIAEIAADLKQRLRKAMRAARSQPSDAGGFGVEDRRTDPEQGRASQHDQKSRRKSQNRKAQQRAGHAERQRIRLRAVIGVEPDHWLQQRGDALIDQRDDADLREVEIEIALKHRINGRQQRRRHVVEEVAKRNRAENRNGCGAGLLPANNGLAQGIKTFPDLCRPPSAGSVLGRLS